MVTWKGERKGNGGNDINYNNKNIIMSPSLGVELGSVDRRDWLSLSTAFSGLEEVQQGRVHNHTCACTHAEDC